jgi:hypothetical protein
MVVKEVVFAAPDITYELGDTGGDNIRTIQANAKSYASRFGGGTPAAGKPASQPAPAPSTPAAKSEKDRKVVIENHSRPCRRSAWTSSRGWPAARPTS